MFINLQTTRTDGGCMYFQIKNDDYMQLPGSGSKANTYKDTTMSGNLNVGVGASQTSIKAYVHHAGHQGNAQIEARWRSQGFIHFNADYTDGLLLIAIKDDLYMYCGLNIIYFYKPTTNASDDRPKQNEKIIENVCETLSKLRPRLYDKKKNRYGI